MKDARLANRQRRRRVGNAPVPVEKPNSPCRCKNDQRFERECQSNVARQQRFRIVDESLTMLPAGNSIARMAISFPC